jgi:spore coat polysaccharide biosynthesis protein SpsF
MGYGDNSENDALAEWCDRRDCCYVRDADLLTRYQDGVWLIDPSLIVRVTGDCPFVPSDEIDRVVAVHRGTDAVYTSNRAHQMPIGSAVDVIEPSVLDALADRKATHPVIPPFLILFLSFPRSPSRLQPDSVIMKTSS